jgi:hypothetical protein
MCGMKILYRLDLGDNKGTGWKPVPDFDWIRAEAAYLFDNPDHNVVGELIERLKSLSINGQTRQYHGSHYGFLEGSNEKENIHEWVEFKRIA